MRRGAPVLALAIPLSILCVSGCRVRPEPVQVEGHWVRVENQTSSDWTDVEIWVNDHYRVTRSSIAAGERFQAPLDAFVAGFGQRFDAKRQRVKGIEVTARSGNQAIRLIWGAGRKHY